MTEATNEPKPASVAPPAPAPAAQTPATSPAAAPNTQQAPAPVADASAPAKAERPEFVDEAYWDADKGENKLADLTKDFADARTQLAAHESRLAQVPEKPDGYAFALPENLGLSEDLMASISADHPFIPEVQKLAHELQLTPEGYKNLLGLSVRYQAAQAEQFEQLAKAELAKLGPKMPARIDAVTKGLNGLVGAKHADALGRTLLTADGVEAFEAVIAKVVSQGGSKFSAISRDPAPSKTGVSNDQWAGMNTVQRLAAMRRAGSTAA